jgi:RNA polymerase sigma-70 factor (sigma-E family)
LSPIVVAGLNSQMLGRVPFAACVWASVMTWGCSVKAGSPSSNAKPGGTAGKRDPVPVRPIGVTDSLAAGAALGRVAAHWDADRAVTVMYGEHYGTLVRIAALLVGDVGTAETVVQDSFVAMHGAWRRLRDTRSALPYLHQCLVNRSRSVVRHHNVLGRDPAKLAPSMPSAARQAPPLLEFTVVRALQALPLRQREALVLTYYGNLTHAQAASAMGISPSAVRAHTAQAIEALRPRLRSER